MPKPLQDWPDSKQRFAPDSIFGFTAQAFGILSCPKLLRDLNKGHIALLKNRKELLFPVICYEAKKTTGRDIETENQTIRNMIQCLNEIRRLMKGRKATAGPTVGRPAYL